MCIQNKIQIYYRVYFDNTTGVDNMNANVQVINYILTRLITQHWLIPCTSILKITKCFYFGVSLLAFYALFESTWITPRSKLTISLKASAIFISSLPSHLATLKIYIYYWVLRAIFSIPWTFLCISICEVSNIQEKYSKKCSITFQREKANCKRCVYVTIQFSRS